MAVRGADAKNFVANVILNVFPNCFVDGKEIRVPVMWNGEEIQVKLSFTAAKTNLEHDGRFAKKPELPENTADIVPIGPLTNEQKEAIINDLKGIIDVDLSFIPMKGE